MYINLRQLEQLERAVKLNPNLIDCPLVVGSSTFDYPLVTSGEWVQQKSEGKSQFVVKLTYVYMLLLFSFIV